MDATTSFGLPEFVAGLLVLALNGYVLLGGGDFGGGVWDLLASGPRRKAQRELIAKALGPIWEANHVWLIVVVVVLFTAFPPAFAAISVALHIPLALLLVGIVLRGAAFVFRSHGGGAEATARWGRVFAVSSTITPLFLGMVVGALAAGDVGPHVPAGAGASTTFVATYVSPWLAPFPLVTGVLAVALFAFLAAVYSAVAAPDESLREDFRRRALGSAAVVLVVSLAGLVVAHFHAPRMWAGLLLARWTMPLQLATGAAAVAAIAALWTRRWKTARLAAALQVSLILWGWAMAQFPYLVPDTITIRAAAAPRGTLVALLAVLALGGAVLAPSLAYLFRTFAAARREEGA